jgi:hypothetical protein
VVVQNPPNLFKLTATNGKAKERAEGVGMADLFTAADRLACSAILLTEILANIYGPSLPQRLRQELLTALLEAYDRFDKIGDEVMNFSDPRGIKDRCAWWTRPEENLYPAEAALREPSGSEESLRRLERQREVVKRNLREAKDVPECRDRQYLAAARREKEDIDHEEARQKGDASPHKSAWLKFKAVTGWDIF